MKGLIYKYFRSKEKKLYGISDRIGCMSRANVDFVLKNNPAIDPSRTEICPNCIEVRNVHLTDRERSDMRNKYGIPLDKTVFVYGGNLGKPQGIPHLIRCLKTRRTDEKAYFLIVGDGTEFSKLQEFVDTEKQTNVKLMKRIPKEDYECMIAACDVGMVFLDHRFTIPNFPSRLLSYMQASMPVLACTDPNTDVGKTIVDGGFGWWCESDSAETFSATVDKALASDISALGNKAFEYLEKHYSTKSAYETIMKNF